MEGLVKGEGMNRDFGRGILEMREDLRGRLKYELFSFHFHFLSHIYLLIIYSFLIVGEYWI